MSGAAPDLSKLRINRDPPPPGVRRAFARTVMLASLAVVVVSVGLLLLRQGSVPTVQVVTVVVSNETGASGGGATSVTANGYVVARTKAAVSAKIPGRLAMLNVSEGSVVQEGQIIARLDNADVQAGIGQAQANLATADASLIEATADRDQLKRESDRLVSVRAQNANLVSQQDLDAAQSKAAQAEARVQAAQARKDAASAGVRLAQAALDNTIIRAPFSGTVLRKEAEVGEVVAPSVGGGLTRGAVVTMADLRTLEVEVDVNEAYIARVTSGQKARITLDAYSDTAFRGLVRQVVPTADRQRATVQVKVSILDHDPRILPEMGAKVDFLEPEAARSGGAGQIAARPIVRVPAAAVSDSGTSSFVWQVREGKLARRVITTGPVSAGFREVRSGLSGGEQLVVGGVTSPREGMRVKVGR
ncbi:MAG: efflux RND transporter periplasmic adaptor subunit [Gemmatimonadales bacterium]